LTFKRKECIINNVKRENQRRQGSPKKDILKKEISINLKNPLDKPHGMWYNEIVKRGNTP
jgi:hypothetical protein